MIAMGAFKGKLGRDVRGGIPGAVHCQEKEVRTRGMKATSMPC